MLMPLAATCSTQQIQLFVYFHATHEQELISEVIVKNKNDYSENTDRLE